MTDMYCEWNLERVIYNVVNPKLKEYKTIDAVFDDGRLLRVVRLDYSHLGSFLSETGHFSLRCSSHCLAPPVTFRRISDTNYDFALHLRINIFEFTSKQWDLVSASGTAALDPRAAAPPATC